MTEQRTRTPPNRRRTPSRTGSRLARLFLIAAVTVSAVAGGALLSTLLDRPDEVATPASGTAAPASHRPSPEPSLDASATPVASVPTATPTATPLPSGAALLAWSQASPPDGLVYTIRWVGDRWMAGGAAGLRAAVWTSIDGLTWEPAPPIGPDPIPMSDEQAGTGYWITDIAAVSDGFLAFGWNRIGCCDGGQAMMWRSTDGTTWSPVDIEGSGFDAYHFSQASAIGPGGAFVVLSGFGLGTSTGILVSDDLVSWDVIELSQGDSFEPASDLAASPDRFIAVGWSQDEDNASHPVAWTSTDGRAWSRLATPDGAARFSNVTWDPVRERFAIGGEDVDGRATIWLTPDGASWGTVTLTAEAGQVTDLSAADGMLFGLGTVGPQPGAEMLAWSSFDGVTWQIHELGTLEAGRLHGSAGVGGAVAVFTGQTILPEHEDVRTAWFGSR